MCIEAKAAIEAAKGAFNIRAHFLGEDGSAVAVMEDFERQDEPEPTRNEVQDFAVSGGDADERWGARRPNAPADAACDPPWSTRCFDAKKCMKHWLCSPKCMIHCVCQ